MFKSENETVAERVNLKKKATVADPPQSASTLQRPYGSSSKRTRRNQIDDGAHRRSVQTPSLTLIRVRQSECDVATNYFLSTYADGCYLEYVSTLYGIVGCSSLLRSSVEAVALACLSNHMSQPNLLTLATQSHTAALHNTNKAIQSEETMMSDETLASVMLLAFYSSLSPNPTEASTIWTNHVRGALALAIKRSSDQMQSTIRETLIYHIISCVQIDCIQRHEHIPADLKRLYCIPLDVPAYQLKFWYLIDELADLGTLMGQSSRVSDMEFICRARSLDELALKLEATMRPDYAYRIVPTDAESTGPRQAQHVYINHRVAQAWNSIRMVRLRLNETIFSHAARESMPSGSSLQDTGTAEAMNAALVNAMEIAREISASVPHFLRQHDSDARVNANAVAWAQSLIWPLCVAGSSPLSSEAFRQSVIEQLRTIGKVAKLSQAAQAAERLCGSWESQEWYVSMH